MKRTVAENIRRARAMSLAELGQRVAFQVQKARWRRQARQGAVRGAEPVNWSLPTKPLPLRLPPDEPEVRALIAEAEGYLRHEWWFFGLTGLREEPIQWRRDPVSKKSAPLKFAFDIDYRDAETIGDAKIIWEKNRHHHLTVLALAYALTRDDRFAAEATAQLLDWPAQNPFLMGLNWTHPLEAGIRLSAWVWCERLLRGSTQHEQLFGPASPLWPVIHQQQQFIAQAYARGSSANNHLIGEMAGLFTAATAWPFFRESARWQTLARESLEREMDRQTFPSGLNRELAFGYHVFTLELFLMAWLEAEWAKAPLSLAYREQLRRMCELMAQLSDAAGNLPGYGDGDDGRAIQLQATDARRDAWLYRVCRARVGANVPRPDEGKLAAAVLGVEGVGVGAWQPPAGSQTIEDAGLYVLARQRGKPREIFVLADAGPHGFLSIAAHAHADALAFTLSVAGQPILVDAGTFDYFGSDDWRAYFRSTRAHNTVVVDGLDQSTPGGPFLWTRHARTKVETWNATDDVATLIAAHDGYRRVGVTHRRQWELREGTLRVADSLLGAGTHEIVVCFHVAPECHVQQIEPNVLLLSRQRIRVRLKLSEAVETELARGAENGGWYSARFGVKKETTSVFARWRGRLPVSLTTVLEIEHED